MQIDGIDLDSPICKDVAIEGQVRITLNPDVFLRAATSGTLGTRWPPTPNSKEESRFQFPNTGHS